MTGPRSGKATRRARPAAWSLLPVWLFVLGIVGCVSPPTIERAGIQYDRAVNNIIMEQLLLNIARARYHHPIHFTVVSNVAATFDFRLNAGVGHLLESLSPITILPLAGGVVSENPTVSIVPVEGEEFTKRLLTPLDHSKFYFLAHQGVDLSILLRLMAREFRGAGLQVQRGFENAPSKPEEYREFRRLVLHLEALNQAGLLYVEPIVHDQTWEVRLASAEIFQAIKDGYHLETRDDTSLTRLRKQVTGRVIITNYNPDILSNDVRYHLAQEAARLPSNELWVDIRPGFPGGDYPFRGSFRFRSFNLILLFLALGIAEEPEFEVPPDPRTGPVRFNPAKTLAIQESEQEPDDVAFRVRYNDRVYAIVGRYPNEAPATRWNLEAFRVLYQLFQMTVTDVSHTIVPGITIAK